MAGAASNAIFAKARAMYGKRILPQEYEKLSSASSLAEALSFLKAHSGYKECFELYNAITLRRAQAEEILRREIFGRYLKLIHYAGQSKNGFFRYMIMSCEVSEILNCISYLLRGQTDDYIFSMPVYLVKYTDFDLMCLAKANNIEEVCATLEHTPYARVVAKVAKGENVTVTDYETALYKYYYSTVISEIDREFRGSERDQLRDVFLIKAELYNVLLILRSRVFFKLDSEEIRKYLLPYRFYLSKKKTEELICAQDYSRSVDVLKNTEYGRKDALFPVDFMEQSYKKLISMQSRRLMRFSSSPAVVLSAYMSLCDIETANLFNIIEGLRYGLEPSEIRSLLIY